MQIIATQLIWTTEISEQLRLKLQKELIDLIVKILVKHDNLHYYQGYHDICLTFLLVAGVEKSLALIEHVTLTHLTYTIIFAFVYLFACLLVCMSVCLIVLPC